MATIQDEKLGTINISDDVISVCAANAALKIDGVSRLNVSLTNKGVKVSHSEEGIIIDIYIIVEYQVRIPQLAWDIQSIVKKETETVTLEKVLEVNIHVQGVSLPGEEK